MEINVVCPEALTAPQLDRWTELQATDIAFDSPFLSPHWPRAVARAQEDTRTDVRVAVLSQNGLDVGFMAARVGAYVAMPAGAPMCDYQAVVAEPGADYDLKALVQALGVHRLDFSAVLEEQTAFAPYAHGRGVSHVVDVSEGYAAYEAGRKAAGVSTLKDADKKRRKAARDAGEPRFTAFSRSSADFESMLDWKRRQFRATNQTDIFETPWTSALLRELFESRDPAFGGALFTLHFGDRLAAAQFNIHGRATIHAWMISHDPQFDRYSPGIQLFQDILRWMGDSPYRRLDMGPGAYRFKRELANAGQGVTHGFVGLPSPAALVRGAAYGVVRAAEALPLGAASELPGKAMRRLDQWRGLR